MTDEEYYEDVFTYGDIQDVEELKWFLIQKGDWLFACACQARIDEINNNRQRGFQGLVD